MPIIKINDKSIHYNINGSGECLLLLHDGFYNTASWNSVRDKFANHFTVIDYDRFGYGKSDKYSEKFTGHLIYQYVDELKAIVDELKLEKFHVCGHCLGGAIALCYAADNPEKINKIIAESVGYFSDYKLLMKSDMTFKPYDKIDAGLKNDLIAMNGKDYAEKFRNYIYDYKKTYIMAEDYSILDKIRKIENPVLIINGDRDFYFDVEHPVTAFRAFKNANLWIVPDTGHAPHITRKDDFVKNVVRFLNNKKSSGKISDGQPF